jgi:hypothetical protein
VDAKQKSQEAAAAIVVVLCHDTYGDICWQIRHRRGRTPQSLGAPRLDGGCV